MCAPTLADPTRAPVPVLCRQHHPAQPQVLIQLSLLPWGQSQCMEHSPLTPAPCAALSPRGGERASHGFSMTPGGVGRCLFPVGGTSRWPGPSSRQAWDREGAAARPTGWAVGGSAGPVFATGLSSASKTTRSGLTALRRQTETSVQRRRPPGSGRSVWPLMFLGEKSLLSADRRGVSTAQLGAASACACSPHVGTSRPRWSASVLPV